MPDFATVVEETLAHVGGALAPAATCDWWRRRGLPLPVSIGQFAWECRLGHEPAQVDFQAAVDLIEAVDVAALPPLWRPAQAFLATWRGTVFLEIDQDDALAPLLFPRIDLRDRGGWLAVAKAALDALSSGLASAGVHRALEHVVAALPDTADPLYVSWMGVRGAPHARFIATVPRAGLAEWLRRIGWPGDARAAGERIDALNPWSSHVPVGIDLAETVGPRVGVELHWSGPPRLGDRTERLLDELATWSELDPARVEAARRWRWGPRRLTPRLQIKVGFAGRSTSAKAYLGAWTEPG